MAGRSTWTTCPRACTPASVRPAQVTAGGSLIRAVRPSARRRAPATVGTSGWRAKPRKAAPSYATRSLQRCRAASECSGTGGLMPGLDELNPRHRRVVARPRAQLENPGVTPRSLGVARPDLLEELVGHVLVPDQGHDAPVLVDAPLAGGGHALLGHRPQRLGFGFGGDQG